MTRQLTAVLSLGLSRHPEKLALEEKLLAKMRVDRRLAVVVVPNLYDLRTDGPAASALQQIDGDMVVLSWMYPRGSHWLLHFHGVDGQVGETRLADSTGQGEEPDLSDDQDREVRVIASRSLRNRKIYCLDLRAHNDATPYLDEIWRIMDLTDLNASTEGSATPSSGGEAGASGEQDEQTLEAQQDVDAAARADDVETIHDPVGRRWYPVIDFSRCTNCMECVDFCLFGVYGIDDTETILVELPDNCRKGCPACSRVCPEKAIIFPQHKTPAIAGAAAENSSMKIDLSKLFGAPTDENKPAKTAEREREEQLLQAGRSLAAATSLAIDENEKEPRPRDELDDLIDELDDVDL